MKKAYIFVLAAAALGVSACSDDDNIFNTSAAERLEQGKADYTNLLCADGGKWVMEYFTTGDEPGYNIVCEFAPDGSVVMSGDHRWIGNRFQSERSLWKVISDNGNVLSFNTYNDVFHIFSTPEDVPGTEVNELGYGHGGDYEFMLMPVEGDNLRMVGKKHGLTIWMHKLPADTDAEQYLASIKEKLNVFSAKFPTLTMTAADGETYSVSNLGTGVLSILSNKSTSPNSQTATGNGIFTLKGFRLMEPMQVIKADDTVWDLAELSWADDGALEGDGVRITAPLAGQNFGTSSYGWLFDKESMSPSLKAAYDAANAALVAKYGSSRDLRNITFSMQNNSGRPQFALTTRCGRFVCNDFLDVENSDDLASVKMTVAKADASSTRYNEDVPEYKAFKDMLVGEFAIVNATAMNAGVIKFSSKSNPDVTFSVNVQ